MAQGRLDGALRHVRRLADAEPAASDRDLIRRFAAQGDPEAFALLVDRHGGMVLAVCRRLLGDGPDADDCFQATWLVLARRAGAVAWEDGIAGWLHAVACRVAARLRARAKPTCSEGLDAVPARHDAAAASRETADEVLAELARLPEKHRAPLVLCYLEGKTNAEAAVLMGLPPGSMSKRLDRARQALRSRLEARGLPEPAAPALLPLLAAPLPEALRQAVLASAGLVAAGAASLTSVTSGAVAALAQHVLREMTAMKMKTALMLALVMGMLGLGVGAAGLRLLADDAPTAKLPAAEPPAKARVFKSNLPLVVSQLIDGEPNKPLGLTGAGNPKGVAIPAGARWIVQPMVFFGALGQFNNLGGQFGFMGAGGGQIGALGMPPGAAGQLGNLGGQFGIKAAGGNIGFGGGMVGAIGKAPPKGKLPPKGAKPAFQFAAELEGDTLKALLAEMKKQSIPGLHLAGMKVGPDALEKIAGASSLRTLVLGFGTGITDAQLEKLRGAKKLSRVDLENLQVTGEGLKLLGKVPGLTELSLHGDAMKSKDLDSLREIKGLQVLRRTKSAAEEEGLDVLKSLPDLKKVELTGGYTDKDLKAFKDMTGLEAVRLWQTAITDETVENLKGNKGLRVLTLDGHWGMQGPHPFLARLTPAGKVEWTIMGGFGFGGFGGFNLGGAGGALGAVPPPGAGGLLGAVPAPGGAVPPGGMFGNLGGAMPEQPKPQFTAKALEKLTAFEKLSELTVNHDKLTDGDMGSIAKLAFLRKLSVFAPEVGNIGVGKLKALTKLETLDVRGTQASALCGTALKAIPTLKKVKTNLMAGDAAYKKKMAAWRAQLPRVVIEPLQSVSLVVPGMPAPGQPFGPGGFGAIGGGGFAGKP